MSTTTSEHRIRIEGWRPASVNELTGGHWAKAAKRKRSDARMVDSYARLAGVPSATGRRRISLVVTQTTGRPLDPDNLFKSLLDACTKAGLLIDDSQRHCETGTVELRRGKAVETTIIIEEIGPMEGKSS
jgi:Holliday junction resolvase RusA-like endonuclease